MHKKHHHKKQRHNVSLDEDENIVVRPKHHHKKHKHSMDRDDNVKDLHNEPAMMSEGE